MTRRRAVTVALGAGEIEWPLSALGQLPPAKIARVGWLSYLAEPKHRAAQRRMPPPQRDHEHTMPADIDGMAAAHQCR
jgi:hypothetical protein